MPTYSFLDVKATIVGPGGNIDLGAGAAVAEEGITIAPVDDKDVMTIGADGKGMHTLRATQAAKITVRLLKTAPANAKLMTLYDAQSLSSTLWGQNTITVANPAVGDTHIATQVAFAKKPDQNNKKDADILEWTFNAIDQGSILGTYAP